MALRQESLSARGPKWRSADTSLISYLSSSVSDFRSLIIALRGDKLAIHFGGRMGDWFRYATLLGTDSSTSVPAAARLRTLSRAPMPSV